MIKILKLISMLMLICYIIYSIININIENNRKILHATQWCQTLADGVTKYNHFEKEEIKSQYMTELKGKYIQGLETWKDPWGNKYKLDHKKGIVYSAGPNSIDYDNDDIVVKYK